MAVLATFYDHIKEISAQESVSMTEAMQAAGELGIRRLEISQNNLIGREDQVGHELAHAGLGISAIPAYFDFGRDPDVEKQSAPTLEAARYLGADQLLVIPGFLDPADAPELQERQVQSMIDGVNRLAELAAGYGVSLVMEDYDSDRAPFFRMGEVRRFLDACPGLFCCFDTGNFRPAGEDVLPAYDLLRDQIRHVHLKDRAFTSQRGEEGRPALDGRMLYPCPVGSGDLPLGEVIARLRAGGYDGIYTIEHYGAAHQLDYLKQSAAWVRAQLA